MPVDMDPTTLTTKQWPFQLVQLVDDIQQLVTFF
jgi:hypothetical protein